MPHIRNSFINAYHQQNSLLFQFIIVEFMESFEEVQFLDNICKRKLPEPSKQNQRKKQIEAALTKLVGSTRDYMRIFSWNFGDGLLAKLRTYCALFLQNALSDEKEIVAIEHYADKIWQSCMQALDIFHENPSEEAAFVPILEKAHAAIIRLSKLVARAMLQFRDDENVIFCILRHNQRLDKLFGSRFVAKLLGKMYPKGLKEVQSTIAKRYTARGFDSLIPVIAEKIAEVEAQ